MSCFSFAYRFTSSSIFFYCNSSCYLSRSSSASKAFCFSSISLNFLSCSATSRACCSRCLWYSGLGSGWLASSSTGRFFFFFFFLPARPSYCPSASIKDASMIASDGALDLWSTISGSMATLLSSSRNLDSEFIDELGFGSNSGTLMKSF